MTTLIELFDRSPIENIIGTLCISAHPNKDRESVCIAIERNTKTSSQRDIVAA